MEGIMQINLVTARLMLIVLGVWLVISAFIWPHGSVQSTNTWVSGALCVAGALLLVKVPEARYFNALLGVYLFVSSWILPGSMGTLMNNLLVGVAIGFAAILPGYVHNGPGRSIHS
jgi:hypothetical protein